MRVRDKGKGHISDYVEEVYGLEIDFFTKDNAGYIKSWKLSGPQCEVSGTSIDKLLKTLEYLKELYHLGYCETKKKEISKNIVRTLLVYIDNLNIIRGFFNKYITEDFNNYVIVDFVEFRDISGWDETVHSARDIAKKAEYLFNNLFLPESYVYQSVSQVPRKRIEKACNDNTAKDIFPKKYHEYLSLRQSLFGGLVYIPYPNMVIEEPMLALDLTSAYIYSLLIEKHCITPFKEVDTDNWEFYLDSQNTTSLGLYKISYTCWSNKIHVYKDIYDNNLEKGGHTVIINLNNVDLKLLISMCTVVNIECLDLQEAKLGYLPKYLLDKIVEEYIKKEETTGEDHVIQKRAVNSIYGGTIMKINDESTFIYKRKTASLAPQWGIWTTSYTKKLLLTYALKCEGWYMSMTDSVYCLDTPKNRELLKEFNDNIRKNILNFCGLFGYDYSKLKNLGTFKVEAEIKKFKAFRAGAYCYTKKDNSMVVKASACDKTNIELNDDLYKDTYVLPTGSRRFPMFNPDTTECEVDGVKYKSEGSYYEIVTKSNVETEVATAIYLTVKKGIS